MYGRQQNPAQQVPELVQYDNGNYNLLLRQQQGRNAAAANESIGQMILQSDDIQIVEEAQPEAIPNISAGISGSGANENMLNQLFESMAAFGGEP